jgi:hypothetical protein
MRAARFLLSLMCTTVIAATQLQAQEPQPPATSDTMPTHILQLRDGSSMVGWLIADSAGVVRFRTAGGILEFPRASVVEIRAVAPEALKNGEYWFPDPNATRLFFAPTGRMLGQGEGYFSDSYLFLLNFASGATDRVTIAAGMSILPTDDFFSQNIYYFTPKVGVYNSPATNVAVGAVAGFIPVDDGHSFGVVYGVSTWGHPDAAFTLGLGYGYFDGKFANSPTVMLGGSRRVSKRVALVTENYMFKAGDPLGLGYGARFFGEKLSVDLGFINSSSNLIFPGIPYVSFAVKF